MNTITIECPACLHVMDQHANVTGKPGQGIRAGDAALCIQCGVLMIFDGITARLATDDERDEMRCNPAVARLQDLIQRGRR